MRYVPRANIRYPSGGVRHDAQVESLLPVRGYGDYTRGMCVRIGIRRLVKREQRRQLVSVVLPGL